MSSNNRKRNEHLKTQLDTGSRNVGNHRPQNVAKELAACDKIGGRVHLVIAIQDFVLPKISFF
jgi:hypothetical protein